MAYDDGFYYFIVLLAYMVQKTLGGLQVKIVDTIIEQNSYIKKEKNNSTFSQGSH